MKVNFDFILKNPNGTDVCESIKNERGEIEQKKAMASVQFVKALLNDRFQEGDSSKKWILCQKVSAEKEVEIDAADLTFIKKAVDFTFKVKNPDTNEIENRSILPMGVRSQLMLFLEQINLTQSENKK